MAKFRLMAGQHIDKGPDGKRRTYKVGEVIETDKDLLKHNRGGVKFALITDQSQATPEPPDSKPKDDLDDFTDAELRSIAAEYEADLTGANDRAEILRRTRKAAGYSVTN